MVYKVGALFVVFLPTPRGEKEVDAAAPLHAASQQVVLTTKIVHEETYLFGCPHGWRPGSGFIISDMARTDYGLRRVYACDVQYRTSPGTTPL